MATYLSILTISSKRVSYDHFRFESSHFATIIFYCTCLNVSAELDNGEGRRATVLGVTVTV